MEGVEGIYIQEIVDFLSIGVIGESHAQREIYYVHKSRGGGKCRYPWIIRH